MTLNRFKDDGTPKDASFKLASPVKPAVLKSVEEALERIIEKAPDEISSEDIRFKIEDFEDGDETVNISVDDVLTKKQKPTRTREPEDEAGKKRIYNNVVHIEHRNKRYIYNTPSMVASLPILLGLLLKNGLLGKHLHFFTDGERSLKNNIFKFFAWHSNIRLTLDWYHLSEKCRQGVSLTMKGNAKEKREIVEHLRQLLWYGQVDKAIEYLQSFPRRQFKTSKDPDYLIGYLERKRDHIPCYALRKALGLKNGSQMGEKSNDILIADRQKHNGMAWSPAGSESLGCLTAIRFNGEMDSWLKYGTLTMSLREPEFEASA